MSGFDAVVIGGGPAGATAALGLARAGWSVAVIEKAAFPRPKVCGEFISAPTWAVLARLGVARALAHAAGPAVARVGLFAGATVAAAAMPRALPAQGGRAVARERLDTLLLERAQAAGADVLQPWQARSLERDAAGFAVVARAREGVPDRTLHARIVIAAHGSWEPGSLPTQGPRVAPRAGDLLGFKARFAGAALARDLMPLVLFPGGYGGLVHTEGGRVSFSCCIRRAALAAARAAHPGLAAGDAVLAHVLETTRGVRDALADARRDGAWLAAGPIRAGLRPCAQHGLFRAGNAAGEAHPLVAEGISMAIQSGWLLAQCLTAHGRGATAPAVLDRLGREYARRWRAQFATRIHASVLFAAAADAAPRLAEALLAAAPALLTWGAWWSGKAARPVLEASP